MTRRFLTAWQSEFGEKPDTKTQADYGRIIDRRTEAAARAKARRERNDPSWTEVSELVEHIQSIADGQALG